MESFFVLHFFILYDEPMGNIVFPIGLYLRSIKVFAQKIPYLWKKYLNFQNNVIPLDDIFEINFL